MAPQLTLQAPLQLQPKDVQGYLQQLWLDGREGLTGAATFTLVVWEPAWLEQHLARLGKLQGPVMGSQRPCLIEAARGLTGTCNVPVATAPLSSALARAAADQPGEKQDYEDLRGQSIDSGISALKPRRMITLAPTIDTSRHLDALVAAYCPLPDDGSASSGVCGDVLVLRGGAEAIKAELGMLAPLIPVSLPCWVLWEGALGEHPRIFERLAAPPRRLIVDTALGETGPSLRILAERIAAGQAVYDLNWYRLRGWRESLAMAFDARSRRDGLSHVVQVDIDVEGDHLAQGLLLAAWVADRLQWTLLEQHQEAEGRLYRFRRPDGVVLDLRLVSVPVGLPKPHAGSIVGVRLLCEPPQARGLCVVLCGEASGCMRLEGGDVSARELVEEVVPVIEGPLEVQETRVLAGGHDSTNPLLTAAAPLAARMLGGQTG